MGCMCCRDREKPIDQELEPLPSHSNYLTEPADIRKPIARSLVRLESSFPCDLSLNPQTPREDLQLQRVVSEPDVPLSLYGDMSRRRLSGVRVVHGGAKCCYLLGKERMGNLVKAEHRDTRKKCWIQTCEKNDGNDQARLVLMKSLDHPHVLKLQDFFQDESCLYAVYEATEGGNAEELSQSSGGVSESWGAAIMQQVFLALSHCHSQGLVLKSLSLRHILFTTPPTQDCTSIKLLIPLGDNLQQDSPYIAPELKNDIHTGPVNDLWNCGVILSSLIAGQCVFMKMQASITSQEFRSAYRKWHDVSKPAKSLTLALIARNYTKRPTPEKCLQHAWILANN